MRVILDSGDRVRPCSYGAMVQQRECYLRTHRGPSRFSYDCAKCAQRDCGKREAEYVEAGER